ncbi:hypothetical protein EW146_g6589 [Bondarzewia mesenterica]|uniref:Uncharacterized protein n=1 Tax=Bondarzewia mesenterica TaxID=1095465 RepID=A0A4S4LN39_9AGAM|nr:hypothetical protein EW146_g6589 [Bondarzewia mesenterica]
MLLYAFAQADGRTGIPTDVLAPARAASDSDDGFRRDFDAPKVELIERKEQFIQIIPTFAHLSSAWEHFEFSFI